LVTICSVSVVITLEEFSTDMLYTMGTSDWRQVGTVFTLPPGTAEVTIRAGICTPENRGGRVWFDDLAVREVR
jgi:hypothetical protein